MSERLLLEAFREDAERLTRLPAFELIEAAGRARRRRRHAIGGVVAACLLAATGIVATTTGDTPDPRPAEDPAPRALATPWPGPTMTTRGGGDLRVPPWRSLPATRRCASPSPRAGTPGVGPEPVRGTGPDRHGRRRRQRGGARGRPALVRRTAGPGRPLGRAAGLHLRRHVRPDAATVARALARMPGFGVDRARSARPGRPPRPAPAAAGTRDVHRAARARTSCSPARARSARGGGDDLYDVWVIDTEVKPRRRVGGVDPRHPERRRGGPARRHGRASVASSPD